MRAEIVISGRRIGAGSPPYIVAELSANHGGSLDRALATVEAAKAAGADAIKLQTYTPDTITIDHDGPDFRIKGGPWNGRRLYDLYKEAHTPWTWHEQIFARARTLGITAFSSPFDAAAVDLLEGLHTPAYKIASFEIIDLPLIHRVAQTGKPTIMSTGMASRQEIGEAVEAFQAGGGRELVLLHCVSGYPVPVEQSNLLRIQRLAAEFGCVVGLSDHSLGVEAAITAVALGAYMIEKHFILRRADGGPDATFSVEPSEFAALVSGAKAAFAALGSGNETRAEVEQSNMPFRRSIYVVRDVKAGEIFTADNLRIIRPGYGLAPKHLPEVIGKRAARALERGTALSWDAIK